MQSKASFLFHARDESDTDRLGSAIAGALPGGAVVALIGALGAGKTRLVRAVARACGVAEEQVTSPTFVLIHEYRGRRPVFHMDVYRVKDDDEFLALGPEEYFESEGIVLVEWADRVARWLPPERMEIRIETTGETERRFAVEAVGERFAAAVERVREALS